MSWVDNPGHPPKFRKPILVKWGSGRVEGPFERHQWSKMNWSLDAAMPIVAVRRA